MNFVNRTVWTGDNLDILRGINSECVDLIYLDPPFKSGRQHSSPIGSKAAGAAFKDTWTRDDVDDAEHGLLASREIPLRGWRIDHIVPTPQVASPLSAPSPGGGGRGTLRRFLGRHRGQTRTRSRPRLDRTITRGRVVQAPGREIRQVEAPGSSDGDPETPVCGAHPGRRGHYLTAHTYQFAVSEPVRGTAVSLRSAHLCPRKSQMRLITAAQSGGANGWSRGSLP